MSLYGPVHKLIVRDPGPPIERYFDAPEFEDFEVQHTSECKHYHSDDWDCEMYDCGVGETEREIGVRWSLARSGQKVNSAGEYWVRAWAETIRGFDFTEYDGGLALCQENGDELP